MAHYDPCVCCGEPPALCCSDGFHTDLIADGFSVTLPDIVPSAFTPCTWTTIWTGTYLTGRTVGLNPVYVNVSGENCDYGIWIRPKYTDNCPTGTPGLCSSCVTGRVILGAQIFQGWWCAGQARGSSYAGYAPATIGGLPCRYTKLEWQVYVVYRPTSTSCSAPDNVNCATGPLNVVSAFPFALAPAKAVGFYALGSSPLLKVPRRCTWRMNYSNVARFTINLSGSFGPRPPNPIRRVVGVVRIAAYVQDPSCTTGNSLNTPLGIGVPPIVLCNSPTPCNQGTICGNFGSAYALLYNPAGGGSSYSFWPAVGTTIGYTLTHTINQPVPPTLDADTYVAARCDCAFDQYIQFNYLAQIY